MILRKGHTMEKFAYTMLVLLVSFTGKFQDIHAQERIIKFDHLSIIQGLSDNRVEAIYQDSKGFMWFATVGGLNRYDGYNFKNYGHISFGTGASVYEDKRGSIWLIQSYNGELFRFDRITEKFIPYSYIGHSAHQVFEDHGGGIWIATWQNGLAKYMPESDSFKIYKNVPGKDTSLPDNSVQAIYEDKSKTLWIGSPIGLYKYDRVADHFVRWKSDFTSMVVTFFEDKKGMLWIGTNDGLCKINNSGPSFELYRYDQSSQCEVQYIYEDSKNRLWTGSTAGIAQFDRLKQKFIYYENNEPVSRPTWSSNPFIEDKNGTIWTGIKLSLKWFDEDRQDFKIYTDYSSQDIKICSIYKDRSGTVWFGSMKDGVFRHDASQKQFLNVWNSPFINSFLTKNALQPSVISLYKDNNGILWIGKPDGLLRINEKNGSVKLYKHIPENSHSLSHDGICAIAEETPNILWLGTYSGGLNRFDKTTGRCTRFLPDPNNPASLTRMFISCLLVDKSGILWAGSDYALEKFNPANGTFTHYYDTFNYPSIIAIFEDKFHTLWVTTSKGVAAFDRISGTFKYLTNDSNDSGKLINKDVNVIYEDKHENLWFCTGNGLDKLDRKSGKFTHIDGNLPDRIIGILEDDKGILWLLTSRGITVYNPLTGKIKNYDESEGVNLNSAFYFPYWKDKSGEMYFGGFNGIIRFHPDSIKDNPHIPPVVITSFQIFNKEAKLDSTISEKKLIKLPYSRNSISFEFASLNYSLPQKNQYAYRLDGVDKDWVYSGTRRFASYPKLQPGTYKFRVRGSNNDAVWNESGTSISLIIYPPWWKTWWAYLTYVLLFFFVLNVLRRYEMNRLSFKNQVKLDLAVLKEKEETEKLKSRFFANISHEFRTPLTLILGPAEKIISGTSNDNKKDANIIKQNSQRLLQLINQLLDLSKLEAGKLKLAASKGNIVSFVKRVGLSFESLFESKSITFQFHPEKEYIELYFDREKMMQVLNNILSNAFKFTPVNGKIYVSIKEIELNYVEIKIRNSGFGIATEQLPKLFDRFYQVDNSLTKEYEGTGIGLALAKELVELHGGNIRAESKQEDPELQDSGWTELIVEFPIGNQHLIDEEITGVTDKPTGGKNLIHEERNLIHNLPVGHQITDEINLTGELPEDKTIILIVEDNYDMREYIKESLDKKYLIEEAVNGEQGVRKAIKMVPDLIISDMMMPKMDGNGLVRILKNEQTTSHIPIILLTAKAGHEDKLEGLETGADDYLTKPFDVKELHIRINNLINIRKKLQEKYGQPENHSSLIREKKTNSIDEKFMLNVAKVIDEHISEEEFDIEKFCREITMSRTQLHRKLKALTGKSASLYIRSVKLSRAKKMIENQEGSISEIAYAFGFSSPVYFTRCFKEEFGYPPSDLKN
jgi:signal transduction histidine kinase/ligand-binding sensor domain-containing protein/DNA-binding response OmpR family regulator